MKLENKTVKNYPSEQMIKRQAYLNELERQGKLKEFVREYYADEIKDSSKLMCLLYNNWRTFGKQIFLDYTGISTDKDRQTVTELIDIRHMYLAKHKLMLWRCSHCGFTWVTSLKIRLDGGCRCKNCKHKIKYTLDKNIKLEKIGSGTSFEEQFIFYSLKQLYPKTMSRAKDKKLNLEYDIVVPELNLCIEHSAYGWHKYNLDRDKLKEDNCLSQGIQFIEFYAHGKNDFEKDKILVNNYVDYRLTSDIVEFLGIMMGMVGYILEKYDDYNKYWYIDFDKSREYANYVTGKNIIEPYKIGKVPDFKED